MTLGGASAPAPRYEEHAPDDEVSHALLTEYFTSREMTFPEVQGVYKVAYPDPARFEPPAGVFLVARDEHGRAVGCGGIRRIDDRDGGVCYEVKHLYLSPDARGRGWGRALLEELERRSRQFGAVWSVLDTNDVLETAGQLYRTSGYDTVEPYNDNPNATTWYAKRLA